MIHKFLIMAKFAKNAKNKSKMPIFQKHLHGGTTYMQKQCIRGATVRVDSPHATLDSAEH